jgi:hypothetical protein
VGLLDRIRLKRVYQEAFSGDPGSEVLKHLCEVGYVFVPTYVRGDPVETAHREGARRLVLSILRMVHGDDEAIRKMAEEHYARSTDRLKISERVD